MDVDFEDFASPTLLLQRLFAITRRIVQFDGHRRLAELRLGWSREGPREGDLRWFGGFSWWMDFKTIKGVMVTDEERSRTEDLSVFHLCCWGMSSFRKFASLNWAALLCFCNLFQVCLLRRTVRSTHGEMPYLSGVTWTLYLSIADVLGLRRVYILSVISTGGVR